LDGNASNGPEDVVLYRQPYEGYSQIYQSIDLKECVIRHRLTVLSPRANGPEFKDALSLMIRYEGKYIVLGYADTSKQRNAATEPTPRLVMASFQGPILCSWQVPRPPMSQ
jgi:hypothetical protein